MKPKALWLKIAIAFICGFAAGATLMTIIPATYCTLCGMFVIVGAIVAFLVFLSSRLR